MSRIALLISTRIDNRARTASLGDGQPRKDYFELADALDAMVINHERVVSKLAEGRSKTALGPALAQALYAVRRRHEYDCILTDSEHVGIPLALIFKLLGVRRGHVMIAHRLSPLKKAIFFRALKVQTHIDKVICYGTAQKERAIRLLSIPPDKVELALHPADHLFWRPLPLRQERLICSAGLEYRDYPTLIQAVKDTDVHLTIAAASPWSRRRNETKGRRLPLNVTIASHSYAELRELYSRSLFVAVPLHDTDFQAGSLVMYEAMATGRATVASKTRGQEDILQDGVTGLYVPPGDPAALRGAIRRLLENPEAAAQMGENARKVVEAGLNLDTYVADVARIVNRVHESRAAPTSCTALA